MQDFNIRQATLDDAHGITVLVSNFSREDHFPSGLTFDRDKTLESVVTIVNNDNGMFFSEVLTYENLIVGCLLGAGFPQLFNHQIVAKELMWYVHPEYRKTRKALTLVKNFEDWAKDHGCDLISLATFAGQEGVERFYKNRGFTLTELDYVKEL